MSFIPREEYEKIITLLPILCVDILIENAAGEYLLVKRANEPKKDAWWPVGGRVLKGETLEESARRKIREEVGVDVESLTPIGFFEWVFDTNSMNVPGTYHTLSIVYRATLPEGASVKLDEQSTDWKFSSDIPGDFVINSFNSGLTAGQR